MQTRTAQHFFKCTNNLLAKQAEKNEQLYAELAKVYPRRSHIFFLIILGPTVRVPAGIYRGPGLKASASPASSIIQPW